MKILVLSYYIILVVEIVIDYFIFYIVKLANQPKKKNTINYN